MFRVPLDGQPERVRRMFDRFKQAVVGPRDCREPGVIVHRLMVVTRHGDGFAHQSGQTAPRQHRDGRGAVLIGTRIVTFVADHVRYVLVQAAAGMWLRMSRMTGSTRDPPRIE